MIWVHHMITMTEESLPDYVKLYKASEDCEDNFLLVLKKEASAMRGLSRSLRVISRVDSNPQVNAYTTKDWNLTINQ